MPQMTCTWIQDDCHYETSCGHAWEFTTGWIAENGVKFCPFCGGLIEEVKEAETVEE